MKSTKQSFILTVLSITLTLWFILFGFSVETITKESYNKYNQSKIEYNFMLVSEDVGELEKKLNNSSEITGYTELSREVGVYNDSVHNTQSSIILCNVYPEHYNQKFNITAGTDLFEGDKADILISKKFSEQVNKSIGESILFHVDNRQFSYKIKGIYESGGVNDNFILKVSEGNELKKNVLFLVKADSESFSKNFKDISIVNIDVAGLAILNMINDFLLVFKCLCFICLLASIIFNFNMIYMNYVNSDSNNHCTSNSYNLLYIFRISS